MNASNIEETEPFGIGTLIASKDEGAFIVIATDPVMCSRSELGEAGVIVLYSAQAGGNLNYTSAYVAQRLDRGEWSVSNADK